ncbi:unnamed protein product [Musa banksii]
MPVSRGAKQRSSDPALSKPNPFDSDSESEMNPKHGMSSSGTATASAAARNRYKNDFRDEGGLENQSVQELESYAAYKAEETTQKVNDCLKIAEVIREDASNTLVMLHQQGEQITRTHETAVSIDQDLSRGEKLLGSLGGFFSRPWKPNKAHQIKGPAPTTDDSLSKKVSHMEQREKLGLSSKPQSNPRHYSEPTSAMDKVQMEKAKQDDTLSDLSDVLGQLKGMAVDMVAFFVFLFGFAQCKTVKRDGTSCTSCCIHFKIWVALRPESSILVRKASKLSFHAVKALNEIKASLGWRVVYAWVGDDPCGDGDLPPWSGVTCSQQGDYRVVTELEVYAVSIVGPFPIAVTNLLDLTRLDLHNNKLTGPIPPQIGQLKHLKILNLRWNKLQDAIPPEIGELKKLTHLYLSFNNFKGDIPVELANLQELRYLYLHENRLTGKIPPELGNLKYLRHLDVGNNHLTGTLRDLIRNRAGFPSLRNLYLNNNQMSGGLPDQLANLTNLEILYLSYNKMIGPVTPKLVEIPRLTNLYLDHNAFTGRIPDGFYKHSFLKELYIEGNQFKPGAKPKGNHKVLDLIDTEFLF